MLSKIAFRVQSFSLRSEFKLQFVLSAALRWRKHAEGVDSERRAKYRQPFARLLRLIHSLFEALTSGKVLLS